MASSSTEGQESLARPTLRITIPPCPSFEGWDTDYRPRTPAASDAARLDRAGAETRQHEAGHGSGLPLRVTGEGKPAAFSPGQPASGYRGGETRGLTPTIAILDLTDELDDGVEGLDVETVTEDIATSE